MVVFKGNAARRCGCVDRIERRILLELGKDNTVKGVFYGTEKGILYILLQKGYTLDTAALGRILREEGARDYEILR